MYRQTLVEGKWKIAFGNCQLKQVDSYYTQPYSAFKSHLFKEVDEHECLTLPLKSGQCIKMKLHDQNTNTALTNGVVRCVQNVKGLLFSSFFPHSKTRMAVVPVHLSL